MDLTRRAAWWACGFSLILGLIFVARPPHPWGWSGFDEYYELALSIARGEGYNSLERLWGYPLFLSFFYRVFGDRPWIPLLVQVTANATIPLMIWYEFRHRVDPRIAAVAGVLVAVLPDPTTNVVQVV